MELNRRKNTTIVLTAKIKFTSTLDRLGYPFRSRTLPSSSQHANTESDLAKGEQIKFASSHKHTHTQLGQVGWGLAKFVWNSPLDNINNDDGDHHSLLINIIAPTTNRTRASTGKHSSKLSNSIRIVPSRAKRFLFVYSHHSAGVTHPHLDER